MELPTTGKRYTLSEQLNESLKIKFRNEIEIRRAQYAIDKMGNLKQPEVQTYLESKKASINEATFNIAQCDDTIKVLQEMLDELEDEED
jgi:hypothetical protein